MQLELPVASVIVMGVLTGVAGGVIVALTAVGSRPPVPSIAGMVVIVGLRLGTILWGLRLPVFSLDRN